MEKKILMVSAIFAVSLFGIVLGSLVFSAYGSQAGLVCNKSQASFQEIVNCQVTAQGVTLSGLRWWHNGFPAPACDNQRTCFFFMPSSSVLIVEVCTAGQSSPCLRGTTLSSASDQAIVSLKSGSVLGGSDLPVDKLALIAPYIALVSAILVLTGATFLYTKHRKQKQ